MRNSGEMLSTHVKVTWVSVTTLPDRETDKSLKLAGQRDGLH